MYVEYITNNSGGSWWLSEAAGWKVKWYRFLGSSAQRATRQGLSLEEAIAEWKHVTG